MRPSKTVKGFRFFLLANYSVRLPVSRMLAEDMIYLNQRQRTLLVGAQQACVSCSHEFPCPIRSHRASGCMLHMQGGCTRAEQPNLRTPNSFIMDRLQVNLPDTCPGERHYVYYNGPQTNKPAFYPCGNTISIFQGCSLYKHP